LGMIALYLLEEWRRSKQRGLIFTSEDDWRAERLGAIMYALEPRCGVMVLHGWTRCRSKVSGHLQRSPGDEHRCYGGWPKLQQEHC
jgi:hypothetical protein